ncbi:MAG TPA: hypothetical protein VGK13_04540 [Methanocellaceae archaeon]
MKLINDIISIFKKDWKLFLATNAFYFGLLVIGALIALADPQVQRSLFTLAGAGLSSGPLSSVGNAYHSGSVPYAAAVTFVTNLLLGTLVEITIPSLIFPPWALFMGLIRSLMWGIMLVVPVEGLYPLGRALPHYLTLLLEGEAYVVAIFACMRQIKALLKPQDFGTDSRWKAYLRSILDNGKLLLVVALLLAVSALYEAWEVMYFAGIIK